MSTDEEIMPIRESEMPMAQHHRLAEEAILKRGGRITHCFRSAFRHIRLAWKLYPIDPEMSLFRAITGEEEAASALMLALIQQQYPGAGKLNPRDHRHKAAISPYLDAVNNLIASMHMPTPKLSLSIGRRPKLSIALDLFALGLSDKAMIAVPDHPFNFSFRENGEINVYLFEKELQDIANNRGCNDIKQSVMERANLRNRLIYASDNGIPNVEFSDSILTKYLERIYRLSILTIGVLQNKEHQLFVTQNLEAFLRIIDKVVEKTANKST